MINSGGDAIKSDNTTDTTKGWITINNGTFNLTATGDGIQAETDLLINGGTFTIETGGGSENSSSKSSSWGVWGIPGHAQTSSSSSEETTSAKAFLAGHESFAAAEGAIGIAKNANKARKEPLRVILNGLGKDAAKIISRINGFTYVETKFDYFIGKLEVLSRTPYSKGERAAVNCYGADRH